MIFCFVEKEYGGTQIKRVKKLYSMTTKDNLIFETEGLELQSITFVPLPFIAKERKWKECLARGDLQLPIRKVKVYDSSGAVTYTEWYRIFPDDPWPLDDHQNDEQHGQSLLRCVVI